MKKYGVLLLLIMGTQGWAQPGKLTREKAIEAAFQEVVKQHQFSGVLLVAMDGKILFQDAAGYRDYAKQTRLEASDIFELASVSKQFTAMIIMMLQEKGKLQFDDPVENYLTIPYKGITIRHLLNHTSGLPDYQAVMDQYWDKSKVAGNEDCIAYLNKYAPPVLFAPGAQYMYSNTGYLLLASIAEKAGGQDFIQQCREKIFRPLGMQHTDIRTLTQKAATENFALGHLKVDNRYVRADSFPSSDYTIWLGNRKGPGRISSTASDLLRWDQALYGRQLVKPTTLQQAFSPAKLNDGSVSNYGFGWVIKLDDPVRGMVYHTGDNPGYHTQIRRYIHKHITLILLNNNNSDAMDVLLDKVEQILMPAKQ